MILNSRQDKLLTKWSNWRYWSVITCQLMGCRAFKVQFEFSQSHMNMLYLQFTYWKWQVHRRITNFFTACTKFKVRAKCRAKKTLTKVILLMSINTQFELTSFQSYYFFPIPKINPTSKKIKNCLFLNYYLFK